MRIGYIMPLGLVFLLSLLVTSVTIADDFQVLVINGDSEGATKEAPLVVTKTSIENHTFTFTEISTGKGAGTRPPAGAEAMEDVIGDTILLEDFQIVYFTWNGPGHDGDYFMGKVEEEFLAWVKAGGIVYMSAMDDNFPGSPGTWMPTDEFPLIVDNTGDAAVDEITEAGQASTIFTTPNDLDKGAIDSWVLDDNFHPTNPDDWEIYATRADNGQPIVCYLPYGSGGYLECCIDARGTFPAAESFIENALYFMAEKATPQSVEPAGKLTTTWGALKG